MLDILFILITILPIIPLGSVGIPSIIVLTLLLIVRKGKIFLDDKLFKLCIFATITTIACCMSVTYFGATIKDYAYIIYPTLYLVIYHSIVNLVSTEREVNKKILHLLKVYIIVQLIFCIIEMTNIFNLNKILEPIYFFWQSANALKSNQYLEITYRPFGTTGSPILLAIIVYIFAKKIQKMSNSNTYVLLALVIIAISGARTALMVSVVIEFVEYARKYSTKRPVKFILSVIVFAIIGLQLIYHLPFLSKMLNYYSSHSTILGDYSVSYRLNVFRTVFAKNALPHALIGGMSVAKFPAYVDCEYIMRILQFGVLGFILLISPIIYIYKINRSSNNHETIIFLFCSMITSFVLTNITLITPIMISLLPMSKNEESSK